MKSIVFGVRKRPRCHLCGGRHRSSECSNMSPLVEKCRQFGTVVDGRYVPPAGVTVRVFQLSRQQNGDDLTRIIKEGKK